MSDTILYLLSINPFNGITGYTDFIVQQEFIGCTVENNLLFYSPPVAVDKYVSHKGVQPGLDIGPAFVLIRVE